MNHKPMIKEAEIVGTRMALSNPGHNVTTNYTYYSVLVYYDDGRVELVEGDMKEIEPYLAYMKSPTDRLREALHKPSQYQ